MLKQIVDIGASVPPLASYQFAAKSAAIASMSFGLLNSDGDTIAEGSVAFAFGTATNADYLTNTKTMTQIAASLTFANGYSFKDAVGFVMPNSQIAGILCNTGARTGVPITISTLALSDIVAMGRVG